MARKYEVVVGNIGYVYSGPHYFKAAKDFLEYKLHSERGIGRAANEPVTMFRDGEILQTHVPDSEFTVHIQVAMKVVARDAMAAEDVALEWAQTSYGAFPMVHVASNIEGVDYLSYAGEQRVAQRRVKVGIPHDRSSLDLSQTRQLITGRRKGDYKRCQGPIEQDADIIPGPTPDEYVFYVKFTRSRSEDDGIARENFPGVDSNTALRRQFVKELQGAYDESGMAGSFEIVKQPSD